MEQEDIIKLFKEYRRKLCNFLYYKCGDMELAEDLVQETFLILWGKKDKVKYATLKNYLYTIANNLFIDYYRRKNVEVKLIHTNHQALRPESPEFILETKEFDDRLQNAISSLTEKERVVFLMNRIDGMTFKEIAEALDISVKAVEKRMHYAVESLFQKINCRI